MFILHVNIDVKPECLETFLQEARDFGRESVKEPGCLRFDVIQQLDDPTKCMLLEVFRTDEDAEFHRTTPQYLRWLEIAPPLVVEPRIRIRYEPIVPEPAAWEVTPVGRKAGVILHVHLQAKPERLDDFVREVSALGEGSAAEPGCVRFDAVRQLDDPTRAMLMEVFDTQEDLDVHHDDPHFARWADAVGSLVIEPRVRIRYRYVYSSVLEPA